MLKAFNDLRIGKRILIALLIPMLGLLAVSLLAVVDKYRLRSEMRQLQSMAELAPEISALAHKLQRERGASAIDLASKGTLYGTELDTQRQATNAQATKLQASLGVEDIRSLGAVAQPAGAALEALANLSNTHQSISGLKTSVADMACYCTPVIRQLIASVEKMGQETAHRRGDEKGRCRAV